MAIVKTSTLPTLLKLLQAGKLNTEEMITHDFDLEEVLKAFAFLAKPVGIVI